jgi:hypothetical protein
MINSYNHETCIIHAYIMKITVLMKHDVTQLYMQIAELVYLTTNYHVIFSYSGSLIYVVKSKLMIIYIDTTNI